MRDMTRQDNMMGLYLFLSSMADSKSAYTTIGAGISYRWLVNRNRISSFDNSYRSRSSIWLQCACTLWFWTTVCDPKKSLQDMNFAFFVAFQFFASLWRKMQCFEIAQILEYIHQSIESGYHRNAHVLHRSTVVCRGIINDHCNEQIVVLAGNLQIGGSD